METPVAWREAFETGKKLRSQNNQKDAIWYLFNAITHAPGKIDIIQEYVEAATELANKDDAHGKAQKLMLLEETLQEWIGQVEPANIPRLLEWVSNLERLRNAIPPEVDFESDVEQFKLNIGLKGPFDETIPASPAEIEKRFYR